MTKPKMKFTRSAQSRRRQGMTLIELLIAIAILVIIAAILVPQLRFATADRNIREASRMVASLFAQASQRAINDGEAGVLIERNPNIIDGTGAYAGTSLFLLRRVPRYTGDAITDLAIPESPSTMIIPMPLEQEDLGIISVGDRISFGDQLNVRFAILALEAAGPGALRLVIGSPAFLTGTPSGAIPTSPSRFTIFRQPRRLVSSRIDLPAGYLVDLRMSGELGISGSLFSLDPRTTPPADLVSAPNSITYLYNARGGIDRFFYTDATGIRAAGLPREPAFLMVREYSTDEDGETTDAVLDAERNMWVTVDPTTGAANVVSGARVNPNDFAAATFQQKLDEARKLSVLGQAAQ